MSEGMSGFWILLLQFGGILIPLIGVLITMWLGVRFVRAVERLASAAETLARNKTP